MDLAVTREGLFVLLCMNGDGTYRDNLKEYFIGKELFGNNPNPVDESSYRIFAEYLSNNGVSLVDCFELPDHLLVLLARVLLGPSILFSASFSSCFLLPHPLSCAKKSSLHST